MKVAITFDFDTDDRLAIERQYDRDSGKPASHDRLKRWMWSTLRSTLEDVGAEHATAIDAEEMRKRFAEEDKELTDAR